MKKKCLLISCALILLLIISKQTFSQEEWEKYEDNPVLDTGGEAMWDEHCVASGSVIKFDGTYHMWYNGRINEISNWQIGYAWSDDGINWTKYPFPVIGYGQYGDWDNYRRVESVILVNDTLKMWFAAYKEIPFAMCIGYAWSVDGISWEIYPDPALDIGQSGTWDDNFVYGPSVIYHNNEYHMWYSANGGNDNPTRIGYANSDDGINWEKDFQNNPVVETGPEGSYYESWLNNPCVIRNDGQFEMWFSGHDVFEHYRIGYAHSADGIDWDYITEDPVLNIGTNETWDDIEVCRPCVFIDNNQYKMWFSGHNGYRYKIGYALGNTITEVDNLNQIESFSSRCIPNPVKNEFAIHYNLEIDTHVIITLINSEGRVIKTMSNEILQRDNHVFQFDASALTSGIYYYIIKAGNQKSTGKIIKIN